MTEGAFNPRLMLWAALASIMAAAGFFLLSTYAPDFRLSGTGGGTPVSKSGTGFAGLVELLGLVGERPTMARSDADLDKAALLIVPLAATTPAAALEKLIDRRAYRATLFILPKWAVVPMPDKPGWESRVGHMAPDDLDRVLRQVVDSHAGWSKDKASRISIAGLSIVLPEQVQWVADPDPYIAIGRGHALITKIDGVPHYVLADPDMLNNQGLANRDRAAAMLGVLRSLKPNSDPVMFDLTLFGAGNRRSLQKLLVEPPFLALTLSLLAAGVLALAHGFVRFGPPAAQTRVIAFGKYALTDTTARLFRRAGRLGALGGRYAALMRARAGHVLGAPTGYTGDALEAWLDALDRDDRTGFTARAAAVTDATTEIELHAGAQGLHQWIQRRKRDR